ncbi:siderophore-interacting protein [Microbacterium halophytorum]|uniref:siderophore-interacting protein n=1 Tax=Microbacterium halophytorum TaxID=2067568 RepID=UPI000CFB6E88|nr:siderophore-interacting protein [Microbacterium halophytorum]
MAERSFRESPNALFGARVRSVRRVSPGFVRVTLAGAQLRGITERGLDQRIKVLIAPGGIPAPLDEPLLPESEWRRRWRELPAAERPSLRSYTVGESRPSQGELDIDFYLHDAAGPASAWAAASQPGDRLWVSAPRAEADATGRHGVQWSPGAAHRFLIAGDETAFPAIRGIVASLPDPARAEVIVEAGDVRDAGWLERSLPSRVRIAHRTSEPGGTALARAITRWAAREAGAAARLGDGFYAWCATESRRVAGIRDALAAAGVGSDRAHTQGYWNDGPRVTP